MSECFAKNIELLKRTNPVPADRIAHADSSRVVKVATKSGDFVPQVDRDGKKILLHSKFDPKTEAERFLSEVSAESHTLFVVAGFGFGYHLESLMARIPRDATLLVLEHSTDIVRAALECRDLSSLLGDKRFFLILDPTEEDIADLMRGRSSRSAAFIVHRGSSQLDGDYYTNLIRIAQSYVSTKDANLATLAKFEKLWTSNITRNVKSFFGNPSVSSFFGAFEKTPAIIVAAGPSLTESIPFIRRSLDSALIIAVDTAYFILRRYGIAPHFCVCVDPQVINARYFEGDVRGKTILVTDPCTHPSVFRLFKGRVIMAGIPFDMMKWIEKVSGEKGDLAHGGSVSTNAYDLAKRLGCSPVVLVGQDLSFSHGLAHARGSYLDEQIHNRVTRLYNAQMMNRFQLSALPAIWIKGINEPKVRTNQKMMIFLNWFEKRNDRDLINATRAGAVIGGVKNKNDESVTFPFVKDIQKKIDSIFEKGEISSEKIESYKNETLLLVKEMIRSAGLLAEKLDRALVLSDELCSIMEKGSSSGGRVNYILDKLGEIDRSLESTGSVKDMVGLTIQKVIHTITEGYNPAGKSVSNEHSIALKSRYMYRGFRDGCTFSLAHLERMERLLSSE